MATTDTTAAGTRPPPAPPSRYWADWVSTDFAALDKTRAIAVLPVAAVEQHGPHLPLKVDAALADGMVAAGLVTPNEATWLGSIRTRKMALDEVARFAGKSAAKGVKGFAAQVVELAFVKDRIDRGFGDARVHALLNDETHGVYAARAAAPVLQTVAAYRAPDPLGR